MNLITLGFIGELVCKLRVEVKWVTLQCLVKVGLLSCILEYFIAFIAYFSTSAPYVKSPILVLLRGKQYDDSEASLVL